MAWLATETPTAVGSGDWLGHWLSFNPNLIKSNAERTAPHLLAAQNRRELKPSELSATYSSKSESAKSSPAKSALAKSKKRGSGLTKKAEPPPTRGVNRDSGTASANGGWLRRLVRRQHVEISCLLHILESLNKHPKQCYLEPNTKLELT